MKNFATLLVILLLSLAVFGQEKKTAGPKFDTADFSEKLVVAEWLVEYDHIAWKSTDLILALPEEERAKLGAEWFCFQDTKGVWHAVYGKFTDGKYELAFHFVQSQDSKLVRTETKIDAGFLSLHSKALISANKAVSEKLDRSRAPRFNQYIKQHKDGTFTVWILPAFQTNGVAVYGGEFIYDLDKTGEKITDDRSYLQENFRGFKSSPPREIWLNFSELEKPPLSAIFFVLYYSPYFTKISIDNSTSISTLIKIGSDFTWLHIEKDEKKPDPN